MPGFSGFTGLTPLTHFGLTVENRLSLIERKLPGVPHPLPV
jgi:hypothetical protein